MYSKSGVCDYTKKMYSKSGVCGRPVATQWVGVCASARRA